MKKIVYCFLGCVCFALGGIGAVLPILPTVLFLLLAAFCFANLLKECMHGFEKQNYIKKILKITWLEMECENKQRYVLCVQ